MATTEKFDLIVIGSGPGGYVAAIRAAQLGLNTAIVEKSSTLGGTCLNVGCIPSKALLHSTELLTTLENHADEHGITVKNIGFDFPKMMKRKGEVVTSLVDGIAGLMKRNKIQRFEATATFLNPHQILLTDKTELEANNFIIATGSEPISLPFLPFDEKRVVSSTGALSLKEAPKKMVVIGGGYIGVELASVYNRLGTEVTIVEMLDEICLSMDKTIRKGLFQILKKQGLQFLLSSKVQEASVKKNHIDLKLENDKLQTDVVLVSVGRRPYTKKLGLEKIGIETNSQGFISVDGMFRTKHPHIYAIGDVISGVMLAHRASEEGVATAEIIAGEHPRINYLTIPSVVYTHPEAAGVGLSEEQAKEAGLELKIGIVQFKGNPRARAAGDMEGLVKVIGEKNTDRLIGLHILGPQASEMIGQGMIALEKKATLSDLANAPAPHPTLSEGIKEAASNALGRAIHL